MAALWHFLFDTPDINVRSILPQLYNPKLPKGAAYETNFNRKILIAVGSGTPLEPYSLKTNGERVWQNQYLKTQF